MAQLKSEFDLTSPLASAICLKYEQLQAEADRIASEEQARLDDVCGKGQYEAEETQLVKRVSDNFGRTRLPPQTIDDALGFIVAMCAGRSAVNKWQGWKRPGQDEDWRTSRDHAMASAGWTSYCFEAPKLWMEFGSQS